MKKLKILSIILFSNIIFITNAQKKNTKKPTTSAAAKSGQSPAPKSSVKNSPSNTSSTQESPKSTTKSSSSTVSTSVSPVGKKGNCFRKGNKVADLTIGFSGWGIPFALQGEHFFTDDISGGVILSYSRYSPGFAGNAAWNFIYGGPRANYHFNRLIPNFPDNLDLYGGLSLGYWHGWISGVDTYGFNYGGTLYFAINAGGRYYFTDNLGAIVELGGGNISAIRAGVSLKF